MQQNGAFETDAWDPDKRVSLIINIGRDNIVEHAAMFGGSVNDAFPSAVEDIRAAGNCLAAECHTAAVFHLMRVAEVGLRVLARDRRVKLPRKEPLGLEAWETIIRELENAEHAIQQYPKTLAQEAQYAFYHESMGCVARFRNVFRNQVMHAREHFGADEATRIFEDVRTFMQTLATRIGEDSRTPVVWKGKKWVKSGGKET